MGFFRDNGAAEPERDPVRAAINELRSTLRKALPELARLAVDDALGRADIITAKELEPSLTDDDRRKLVMFSAFIGRGANPTEAMKIVMGAEQGEK